jgi:predicted TIM-barrel fold metal-dependent hydrolase
MAGKVSRRDFAKKAGGGGLLGAAGLAGLPSAAAAQNCGPLPFGLTREDLVHLYEGPWRGLRAVVEKKVIDFHGHPFQPTKQALTERENEAISARQELTDFTDDLIQSMDIHGIAKQCLMPPKLGFSVTYREFVASVSRYPDRLILFADPRTGDTRQERMAMRPADRFGVENPTAAVEILRARLRQGAKAIGEVTFTQTDFKKAFPIVELAMEFDVPVFFGVRAGRYAERSPGYVGEIASAYPQAKIVLGDAGGKNFMYGGGWEAVIILATYGNVYLEIGAGPVELIDAAVRHAGADRILFGSDWGRPDPRNYLPPADRDAYLHWRNLNAVALSNTSEAQKELILYKNAVRLLKLDNG